MMPRLNYKIIIFVLVFLSTAFLVDIPSSFAAVCAPSECNGAGEYVCGSSFQADDMCCTGGGCPSWACISQGYTYYGQGWCWKGCPDSGPDPWGTWRFYCWESAYQPAGTCRYCAGCTWGSWGGCSASCGGGTQSRSDNCGNNQTRSCNTQACPPSDVTVQGYIWDATGQSCTSSPDPVLEIQPADLTSGVTISAAASSVTYPGNWDPVGYTGHSYEIGSIPMASVGVINETVSDPVSLPGSKYSLVCVDSNPSSAASFTASSNPTTVHLGYAVEQVPWFTVFDGDVFGGCDLSNCPYSVVMATPATISGNFSGYLIENLGTVFADSDISVSGDNFSEDSNRAVRNMESSSFWPTAFSFIPPSDAVEITGTDCDSMFSGALDPSIVYEVTADCVQSGIDTLGGSNYSLTGDGVATIFVTGN